MDVNNFLSSFVSSSIALWKDYIEFTKTTSIYPKDSAIDYLLYGIISEVGEFDEAADICFDTFEEQHSIDDVNVYSFEVKAAVFYCKEHEPELYDNLIKEIGDIFWYIAQLIDVLELPLEYIINAWSTKVILALDDNEANVTTDSDLIKAATKLADIRKKDVRDGYAPSLFQQKVLEQLQHLYVAIMGVVISIELTELDIINANKEKLSSRKERDVLGGSGDDR